MKIKKYFIRLVIISVVLILSLIVYSSMVDKEIHADYLSTLCISAILNHY